MLCTQNLSALPEPARLERLMQSLAMIDAILSPNWELRYYSFDAGWGEGERMGSMRNGQGDDLFALFSDAGCFIKGFDHEAALEHVAADEFYRQVPTAFSAGVEEVAFSPDNVTFCYWWAAHGAAWEKASVGEYLAGRDGSEDLLWLLDGDPGGYVRFAEDYFEMKVPPEAVAYFYTHRPLTEAAATLLNPDADYETLKQDAAEIGYPVAE